MTMNRVLIAVAIAGWALYGFSVLRPQGSEAEIARLSQAAEAAHSHRDALALELERLKDGNGDLQHVQRQIVAATQELKHLEYLRARVSGEIDLMRPQPSDGPSHVATPEGTVSPMGSAGPADTSPPSSTGEISKAQQALTMLGYGPLIADGIFGPGTRRSIETFQQGQGLPVTGRLDADTIRALRAAQMATQP